MYDFGLESVDLEDRCVLLLTLSNKLYVIMRSYAAAHRPRSRIELASTLRLFDALAAGGWLVLEEGIGSHWPIKAVPKAGGDSCWRVSPTKKLWEHQDSLETWFALRWPQAMDVACTAPVDDELARVARSVGVRYRYAAFAGPTCITGLSTAILNPKLRT